MEAFNPQSRSDRYGSKINRAPWPWLVVGLPWLSILLGSLAPFAPIISPAPVMPPVAFLLMIAWRFLRPGLLPLWAGLPLGLFDDLFSGQPMGSGVLLFSLAMIAIELVETRFPWRGFWHDWIMAAFLIVVYVSAAALISGAELTFRQLELVVPQALLSIVLFPIIVRMVALLDRVRLRRGRRLD